MDMAGNLFNLRHLRAFCETARTRSVSAAAERVHLSQPAITQALMKLERDVCTTLFERKTAGMFLTQPGEIFLRRVQRALEFASNGCRLAAQAGSRGRKPAVQLFANLISSSQLAALVAVGEHGNFSLAARHSGVSQPSLHRMARDLERVANVTLFKKSAQGIELTPPAMILAQHARLMFAELAQGLEEIGNWRGLDNARISVGSLPLMRSHILPVVVHRLTQVQTGAEVHILDGPFDTLLHELRYGNIDLLVGALRPDLLVDDVFQRELFTDRLSVVARHGHPLAGKAKVTAKELAQCEWVVPRDGTPTRDHFNELFVKCGFGRPRRLVEASSLVFVRGLLSISDRLTIMSVQQLKHEIEQGVVEVLKFDLPGTDRPIGITCRRNWQPTATQQMFMDLLETAAAEAAASLLLSEN